LVCLIGSQKGHHVTEVTSPARSPLNAGREASQRMAEVFSPKTIDALLKDAKAAGTPLDGVEGLLNQMTKAVLDRALEAEMTDHLGYEVGDPAGRGSGNSRNGKTTKTVSTANGPVEIDVPRDRNGSFEPQIVPKHSPPGRHHRGHDPVIVFAGDDDPRYRGPSAGGVRCVRLPRIDLECD
jgi:hypothetical protein